MQLLNRKAALAIVAVIDIALHARGGPVAAKALAQRHRLPPRHLEPVLQAMVRQGILKGIRGPRGGYELAHGPDRISVEDILRAANTIEDIDDDAPTISPLLDQVVMPALAQAERAFCLALERISLAELTRSAENGHAVLQASAG
jgi:Rrf2 family iron-sulfur cluster assembly transcriptional regulator